MPATLQIYNGKLLIVGGRLAMDPACCCDLGQCFWVTINRTSGPEPSNLTPPGPTSGADHHVLWHGNALDDFPTNSEPGENYNNEGWLIEACISADDGQGITDYIAELSQWGQDNTGLGEWGDDFDVGHEGACDENDQGTFDDLMDYLRELIGTPVSGPPDNIPDVTNDFVGPDPPGNC